LARVDDNSRRAKVESARRLIYEKGYAVDGKAVDGLLQAQSLVPTKVSATCYIFFYMGLSFGLEYILVSTAKFGL
jgi:hypothetical protein